MSMANEYTENVPFEVTEAAGEWFDQLQQEHVAEEQRDKFVRWLLRSPTHVEEFLNVMAMHDHFSSELKKQPEWLDKLLHDVKDNVVALSEVEKSPTSAEKEPTSTTNVWMKVAAAFAGIAIFASVIFSQLGVDTTEVVSTAIGEQRSVVLADRSVVDLNTDTQIQITMDESVRHLKLIKGEAIFQVAKDPSRPFRVESDSVVVEAIGTQFNVYRKLDELVVTVVEGLVAVSHKEIENLAVEHKNPKNNIAGLGKTGLSTIMDVVVQLSEGNQATIKKNGNVRKEAAVNLEQVTAWTERRLIFDNETLENIVKEFNRYNRSSLSIIDPAMEKRRLSGVFNANDPEAFLNLVNNLEGINIELTLDDA